MSWDELGDVVRNAQAAANRPLLLHQLATELLPQVDDVDARLRGGARVADIGAGAVCLMAHRAKGAARPCFGVRPMSPQTTVEHILSVRDDDHARGSGGAPVVVVEYGDYGCPFCQAAEREVRTLRDRYGDQIAFVFRHMPVPELHPGADLAAEAAEAAGAQDRFWDMHDRLLTEPFHLGADVIRQHAVALGLDLARFTDDIESHAHGARVRRDVEEGLRVGVHSTPQFFVNGEPVRGRTPLEHLFDAVAAVVAGGEPGPT